ncbi:MAG: hypothetical protein KDD33_00425 [Bdellovibrionales bacterium]|nr:hypothetical protein [Bdellovibrionales bacterium]
MGFLTAYFAHFVIGAIVTLTYLAFRVYQENSKFTKELQVFLNLKTVSYNRARATNSVLKTRLANLERENLRLKKSIEVLSQDYNAKAEVKVSSNDFIESRSEDVERIEQELNSVRKLLDGDLKTQVKDFERELEWLNKRLADLQKQIEGKRRKAFESLSAADINRAA